jgi:hypothetical protein
MARERWFYAQHHQRRGPVPLGQLVESVLSQPDPRSVLIWRKGFADWTQAEDIPEIERKIAPFLDRKEAEQAARRRPAPVMAPEPVLVAPVPVRPAQGANPLLLYGGLATGVVVTGLVAWLLWPSSEPTSPQVVPLGGTTAENAPAIVIPAPGSRPESPPTTAPAPAPTPEVSTPPPVAAPVATPPPPPTRPEAAPSTAAVADQEADLPRSEVAQLKNIAAWKGTELELTVVNNTSWRITEIYATVQRFVGNEVVEDDTPILLLPPTTAVNDEVASLLNKVAPDRKKPGLNPLDTGKFTGQAGPPPEGFRCEIVSARGYPPR